MIGVADMTSEIKREEGISKCEIGCKVMEWSTVPKWCAGMSHRLQSEARYPVGTQERHTGCKQEYGTQLVHRSATQVVNK